MNELDRIANEIALCKEVRQNLKEELNEEGKKLLLKVIKDELLFLQNTNTRLENYDSTFHTNLTNPQWITSRIKSLDSLVSNINGKLTKDDLKLANDLLLNYENELTSRQEKIKSDLDFVKSK